MLPARYNYSDRIKNISKLQSDPLINLGKDNPAKLLQLLGMENLAINHVNTTDGVRLTLENEDIVHLRPSGNAPELRCYTESNSANQSKSLADTVLSEIKVLV